MGLYDPGSALSRSVARLLCVVRDYLDKNVSGDWWGDIHDKSSHV